MPRIPRSEASVPVRYAEQPTMSPDALTGPGRALQGLGRALGDFGAAMAEPGDSDVLTSQLAQMDAATESNKYFNERVAALTPDADPDQWHQETTAGIKNIWDQHAARVPAYPKLRQSYQVNQHRFVGGHDVQAHAKATNVKTERFAAGAVETFKAALEGVDPTTPEGVAVLDTVGKQIRRVPGIDAGKAEEALADKVIESIDRKATQDPVGTLENVKKLRDGWSKDLRTLPPEVREEIGPQSNAAPGLGAVSARYESGGRGVGFISSGRGDPGGQSYGVHQLSGAYSMGAFLRSDEGKPYAQTFAGSSPATDRFNQIYRQVSARDPQGFAAAQKAFYTRTHYEPVRETAAKLGFDVNDRGVQEALFSMGVQHGKARDIVARAAKSGDAGGNPQAQIKALYEARSRYVAGLRTLPPATKRSVLNRYKSEVRDALRLAGSSAEPDAAPVRVASLQGATVTDASPNTGEPQPEAPRNNVIPAAPKAAEPKVADASGLTPEQFVEQQRQAQASAEPGEVRAPQPQWNQPSIRTRIIDKLEKKLPVYQKAADAVINGYVKRAEDSAADGYVLPEGERSLIEGRLLQYGSEEQIVRYQASTLAAQETAQKKQLQPGQLAAEIDALKAQMAQDGANPQTIARAKALDGLHAKMTKQLEDNPLGWAVEANVIPGLEPITPETFSAEALAKRAEIRDGVADHFGKPSIKAFSPDERAWMEDQVKAGGDQMIAMFGAMYEAFGPDTPDVIAEVAPKNPEAVRAGYLLATGGDPAAARDIAKTMQRRADPNYKPDTKIDTPLAEQTAQTVFADFYKNQPREFKDATMRAAEAIYMARVEDPTVFDEALFKDSLEAAVGTRVSGVEKSLLGLKSAPIKYGGVVVPDGQKTSILVPSNVRQDSFRPMLDSITAADLAEADHPLPVDANGKPLSLTRVMNGRIVQFDHGKYLVDIGDGSPGNEKWVAQEAPVPAGMAVENVPKQPFVIDLKRLEPVLRKKNPQFFGE